MDDPSLTHLSTSHVLEVLVPLSVPVDDVLTALQVTAQSFGCILRPATVHQPVSASTQLLDSFIQQSFHMTEPSTSSSTSQLPYSHLAQSSLHTHHHHYPHPHSLTHSHPHGSVIHSHVSPHDASQVLAMSTDHTPATGSAVAGSSQLMSSSSPPNFNVVNDFGGGKSESHALYGDSEVLMESLHAIAYVPQETRMLGPSDSDVPMRVHVHSSSSANAPTSSASTNASGATAPAAVSASSSSSSSSHTTYTHPSAAEEWEVRVRLTGEVFLKAVLCQFVAKLVKAQCSPTVLLAGLANLQMAAAEGKPVTVELKLIGRYEEVTAAKSVLEELVSLDTMCTSVAFGNMICRSSSIGSKSSHVTQEGLKGLYWPPTPQLKELRNAGATFTGVDICIRAAAEEIQGLFGSIVIGMSTYVDANAGVGFEIDPARQSIFPSHTAPPTIYMTVFGPTDKVNEVVHMIQSFLATSAQGAHVELAQQERASDLVEALEQKVSDGKARYTRERAKERAAAAAAAAAASSSYSGAGLSLSSLASSSMHASSSSTPSKDDNFCHRCKVRLPPASIVIGPSDAGELNVTKQAFQADSSGNLFQQITAEVLHGQPGKLCGSCAAASAIESQPSAVGLESAVHATESKRRVVILPTCPCCCRGRSKLSRHQRMTEKTCNACAGMLEYHLKKLEKMNEGRKPPITFMEFLSSPKQQQTLMAHGKSKKQNTLKKLMFCALHGAGDLTAPVVTKRPAMDSTKSEAGEDVDYPMSVDSASSPDPTEGEGGALYTVQAKIVGQVFYKGVINQFMARHPVELEIVGLGNWVVGRDNRHADSTVVIKFSGTLKEMEKASAVLVDVGRETGCSVTVSNPVLVHEFMEPFPALDNMQGKHAIPMDSIQGPFLSVDLRIDGTDPHEVLDYMRTAILELSHHSGVGYQINPKDVVISQVFDTQPSTSSIAISLYGNSDMVNDILANLQQLASEKYSSLTAHVESDIYPPQDL